MAVQQLFFQIALAGMLGAFGQVLRMIPGLTKLNQEAKENNWNFWELFVPAKAAISILIGFVAGALAWFLAGTEIKGDIEAIRKICLPIIAAGYAGADFIEGMMGKILPKSQIATNNAQAAKPTSNN